MFNGKSNYYYIFPCTLPLPSSYTDTGCKCYTLRILHKTKQICLGYLDNCEQVSKLKKGDRSILESGKSSIVYKQVRQVSQTVHYHRLQKNIYLHLNDDLCISFSESQQQKLEKLFQKMHIKTIRVPQQAQTCKLEDMIQKRYDYNQIIFTHSGTYEKMHDCAIILLSPPSLTQYKDYILQIWNLSQQNCEKLLETRFYNLNNKSLQENQKNVGYLNFNENQKYINIVGKSEHRFYFWKAQLIQYLKSILHGLQNFQIEITTQKYLGCEKQKEKLDLQKERNYHSDLTTNKVEVALLIDKYLGQESSAKKQQPVQQITPHKDAKGFTKKIQKSSKKKKLNSHSIRKMPGCQAQMIIESQENSHNNYGQQSGVIPQQVNYASNDNFTTPLKQQNQAKNNEIHNNDKTFPTNFKSVNNVSQKIFPANSPIHHQINLDKQQGQIVSYNKMQGAPYNKEGQIVQYGYSDIKPRKILSDFQPEQQQKIEARPYIDYNDQKYHMMQQQSPQRNYQGKSQMIDQSIFEKIGEIQNKNQDQQIVDEYQPQKIGAYIHQKRQQPNVLYNNIEIEEDYSMKVQGSTYKINIYDPNQKLKEINNINMQYKDQKMQEQNRFEIQQQLAAEKQFNCRQQVEQCMQNNQEQQVKAKMAKQNKNNYEYGEEMIRSQMISESIPISRAQMMQQQISSSYSKSKRGLCKSIIQQISKQKTTDIKKIITTCQYKQFILDVTKHQLLQNKHQKHSKKIKDNQYCELSIHKLIETQDPQSLKALKQVQIPLLQKSNKTQQYFSLQPSKILGIPQLSTIIFFCSQPSINSTKKQKIYPLYSININSEQKYEITQVLTLREQIKDICVIYAQEKPIYLLGVHTNSIFCIDLRQKYKYTTLLCYKTKINFKLIAAADTTVEQEHVSHSGRVTRSQGKGNMGFNMHFGCYSEDGFIRLYDIKHCKQALNKIKVQTGVQRIQFTKQFKYLICSYANHAEVVSFVGQNSHKSMLKQRIKCNERQDPWNIIGQSDAESAKSEQSVSSIKNQQIPLHQFSHISLVLDVLNKDSRVEVIALKNGQQIIQGDLSSLQLNNHQQTVNFPILTVLSQENMELLTENSQNKLTIDYLSYNQHSKTIEYRANGLYFGHRCLQ